MEETDISSYSYTKAIYFFNRSADYCIKKCGILSSNNNGKLTSAQEANLRTCAENSAIATKVHAEYMRKLAESKNL